MDFLSERRKVFFTLNLDINERNNELVKILQALRSKNPTNVPPQGAPKMPIDMSKQSQSSQPKPPTIQPQSTSNPQQTPVPSTQSTAPKPLDPSQVDK